MDLLVISNEQQKLPLHLIPYKVHEIMLSKQVFFKSVKTQEVLIKEIEEKYPKDKEVEGEVVRKEKYGYFVRLEAGIEGLIHISKLTGQEEFKSGQKIKAFIERVNEKERRMSLVLPQKEKPVMYR